MVTVSQYTENNVLVIPQSLFTMKDVALIAQYRESSVFYKNLEDDLLDVEFYVNSPCFVFIDSGLEIVTNANNESIELKDGMGIFFPQGLNLHSDFVKATDDLKAYLVFFDDVVIADYLSRCIKKQTVALRSQEYYRVEDRGEIRTLCRSLHREFEDPGLLAVKLLELLYLIDGKDEAGCFRKLLSSARKASPKRNLVRLLNRHDLIQLSVSDLAQISGRSLSSFNRDFKAQFGMPPKQWLQDKRLSYSKSLLEDTHLTVTEVAVQTGYENVSHFIKAFKERYGSTPKQIKNQS